MLFRLVSFQYLEEEESLLLMFFFMTTLNSLISLRHRKKKYFFEIPTKELIKIFIWHHQSCEAIKAQNERE